MKSESVTIPNTTIEKVISTLERITQPNQMEILDPTVTGWGYRICVPEQLDYEQPALDIFITVQRQNSVINKERNKLTIDFLPLREDLNSKAKYPDRPIRNGISFQLHEGMRNNSVEVLGTCEGYSYYPIEPYFVLVWNQMCRAGGALDALLDETAPSNATLQEKEIWLRIFDRATFDELQSLQAADLEKMFLETVGNFAKQADTTKQGDPNYKDDIGYLSVKKIDDIFTWLEQNFKSSEPESHNVGELKTTYYYQRVKDTLQVFYKTYPSDFNLPPDVLIPTGNLAFSFEVNRITGDRYSVKVKWVTDNSEIKKLFFDFLKPFRDAFNVEFGEIVKKELADDAKQTNMKDAGESEKSKVLEPIIVLLPEAQVDSHFDPICESTRFDFGRGLAYFDRLHVLSGTPHEKRIYIRGHIQQSNQNDDSIGRVKILPVGDNSLLTFVTESPNADFDEFTQLVINYFEGLNLLQPKKQPDTTKLDDPKGVGETEKPKNEKQELKTYERILQEINFEDKTGWDMELIKMWNEYHSRDEIAARVYKTPQRVTNRISELRRMFGKNNKDILPYDKDRKKEMLKSRDAP
jgi:hypothetical protein